MAKKIEATYIFGGGRKDLIYSKDNFAKDFFYGYFQMKQDIEDINFVEFSTSRKKGIINNFLYLVSKVLRKISKLSFFFENICTFENFKILKNSKRLIITNDRIALSLVPLLIVFKILKLNSSSVIVMGLLAKETSNLLSHMTQRFLLNIFFRLINNFIFLSKGEFNQANISFKHFKEKFHFIPFSVDENYWVMEKNKEKNKILFIGNDGRREYDFALNIASSMPEYDFLFVTSNIEPNNIKSNNVTLIKGQWNQKLLTDSEIKEIYNKSLISIIPIRNSYQPSGQSVALQSMSMNVPVIITETIGFWDKDVFIDNVNIFFVSENKLDLWTKKITDVLTNESQTKLVIDNSKKLISEKYNTDLFYRKIKKVIFSSD
tara:strand:+ start:4699 stop:5826 length:1128 start_codon:yes stop_codon:yes gene_type:complete